MFVISSHYFVVSVVELSAHSLDLSGFVLSSHKLVFLNAFEVNRVKVSVFPLLLLANPVHTGFVQLLVVLNIGNGTIIVDQFRIYSLNFLSLFVVIKIFFQVLVGID